MNLYASSINSSRSSVPPHLHIIRNTQKHSPSLKHIPNNDQVSVSRQKHHSYTLRTSLNLLAHIQATQLKTKLHTFVTLVSSYKLPSWQKFHCGKSQQENISYDVPINTLTPHFTTDHIGNSSLALTHHSHSITIMNVTDANI